MSNEKEKYLNYKDRKISVLDAEALIYCFTTPESIVQVLINQIEARDIPNATMLREIHERDKINWKLDKLTQATIQQLNSSISTSFIGDKKEEKQ